MPFNFEDFRKHALEQNHSEEYILSAIEYAKILDDKDLPVLFSTIHFAILMNIKSDILKNLINSYNYTSFQLKKRNGNGYREIMVPNEKLKYVQRWINYNILQKCPLSDACKGFRLKHSIKDNAKVHENGNAILKVDLLRFFDTITDRRVFDLFKSMGYVENLAFDLAKICTAKHKKSYWSFVKEGEPELEFFYVNNPPILPQGAPTSPMIANLIATKMDLKFLKLSEALNFRYSRYADDLTFSISDGGRFPSLNTIKKIVNDEGFFINNSKIKYFKKGMKQYVTGLTVTHGVHVSKNERKHIFKHLYYCQKFGPSNHLKHFSEKNGLKSSPFGFQDWLLGKISFIYSIDKINGTKMFKEFEKINWSIDPDLTLDITDNDIQRNNS